MSARAARRGPPVVVEQPSRRERLGTAAAAFNSHQAFPVVAVIVLFVAAAAVYAFIGTRHVLENVDPDEVIFAKLSQNFAAGDGLSWRGAGWGRPVLWPVVLSSVWHFGSAVDGYDLARVLGAALASATVIPTWLLGRELVGPRLALVPAFLSVAGAWMMITASILSDNLAYPLATASLACTVMAVRDTRMRWVIGSVVFATPAVLTRTQLLVLPVILIVALAFDVVRQPRGERLARFKARPRALWAVLVVGVVALVTASAVFPSLSSYAILSHHMTPGGVLAATGRQGVAVINMLAVVPVAAAVALAARSPNWRDEVSGPLLVTLSAALIVLLPVVGLFETYGTAGPVDRYAMYLAPLFSIALVVAPGRIGRRIGVAAAIPVAAAMAFTPAVHSRVEQPALFGAHKRLGELTSLFGGRAWVAFVIVALVLAAGGGVALTWRRRGSGLAIATAIVAAAMIAQGSATQAEEIALVKTGRATLAPPRLDWVDPHVDGRVAMVDFGKPQSTSHNYDLYTDFYNKRVDGLYATVPAPGGCRISIAASGLVNYRKNTSCSRWPRYLVIMRSVLIPVFVGQRELARTPLHGTLVQIPPRQPRLIAALSPPCQLTVCTGGLRLTTFLDAPGRVAITFGPAPTPHELMLDGQRRLLAAHRTATLRFDVPKGAHTLGGPVSWTSAHGAPVLQSVVVSSGAKTTRLY